MRKTFVYGIFVLPVALAGCLVAWGQSQIAVPSGRFLYVNDNLKNQNVIEAFVVVSNGALVRLAGSPFMTRGKGDRAGAYTAPRITLGATGNFLYVANEGSGDISTFKIDSNTGIPTLEGTPQSTGGSGFLYGIGLAASPDGKFLFAGNGSTGNIGAFSLGLDGRLKTVSGSPFTTGGSPDGVKVTPDSKFLMVALPGDYGTTGEIVVFAIASDGSLSQVAGSPFSTYGRPAGLDIDCSGKYLFVGDATTGHATVEVYAIGASGALTSVPGSPFIEYSV